MTYAEQGDEPSNKALLWAVMSALKDRTCRASNIRLPLASSAARRLFRLRVDDGRSNAFPFRMGRSMRFISYAYLNMPRTTVMARVRA